MSVRPSPPGRVGQLGADIDVVPTEPTWPVTSEEEKRHTELAVLEIARPRVKGRRVDPGAEVHGGLPVKVIVDMLAVGGPHIEAAKATRSAKAVEEHQVTVAREGGDGVRENGVDHRAEGHRRSPRGVLARPF